MKNVTACILHAIKDDISRGEHMNQYLKAFGQYEARMTEWGDASLPDIVCFHGLGSTCLSFIEIADLLKDRYHIIAFDLPGHGKTPGFDTDEAYEASSLTRWIALLLDDVAKETFHILAHSWGASVALHYAASYPNKVKKMMLLDGGYHDFQMSDAYFKEKYAGITEGYIPPRSKKEAIAYYQKDFDEYVFGSEEEFFSTDKKNYTRLSPLLKSAIYDLMRKDGNQIKYHATGDTARAVIQFQYAVPDTLRLDQINCDLLLLYCDLPESYFEIRKQMIEKFSRKVPVKVKLYRNTTHMMHWDHPQEVAKDLEDWICQSP